MLKFRTYIVFSFLIVALFAATTGISVCDDSHGVTCETACPCDCHTAQPLTFCNNVTAPIPPDFQFSLISHPQWLEILLLVDVFRPPISA